MGKVTAELLGRPELAIFKVGMSASKSLLKLTEISGCKKFFYGFAFLDDADFSQCVFFEQMLGNTIKKLEHARWSNNVDSMKLVFIVALDETQSGFHGFDQVHGTHKSNIDDTHHILYLSIDEHVLVHKFKKKL